MIKENYDFIMNNVKTSAQSVGKDISDITVIGVTKTVSTENIQKLYDQGLKVFGENKVQELLPKIEQLPKDISWHFIGTLQSNKVKQIVGKVDLIQSVDSIKLIDEIDKCAKKLDIIQNILIEVNIGDEDTKSGVNISDLSTILEYSCGKPNIFIKGLMCIPPKSSSYPQNQENFRKMRKLFVDNSALNVHNIHMAILSMGMSSDYEDAIKEGANMVRIGQAFFGERIYK